MASTESATKLSGVLASLSEKLGEFRSESAEIESMFFELVEGIADFGPAAAASGVHADTTTTFQTKTLESIAVERLETLDRSIAEQREELVGRQDQLSEDVGQLRELVDRQVQLFTEWIDSTTNPKNNNGTRRRGR